MLKRKLSNSHLDIDSIKGGNHNYFGQEMVFAKDIVTVQTRKIKNSYPQNVTKFVTLKK